MTNTEDIVKTLSFISSEGIENPNLTNLIEIENISLPLAFAVDFGYATLTPKGETELQGTYDHIKAIADERGLESVTEIVYTETPVPTRQIFIKF